MQAYLRALMVESVREGVEQVSPGDKEGADRALAAVQYINDHLGGVLRLAETARRVGMGRTRFTHAFRQVTGTTFAEYVVRRRLECARYDVLADQLKPDVVATRWGFYDACHLQRLYGRAFGCTPSEERRRNAENRGQRDG